jgi:uncharacterized membrane protein
VYKLTRTGQVFFAIGIICLGVLSFIMRDFIVGRPPEWRPAVPGKLVFAYTGAAIVIITGIAIIIKKNAGMAALITGLLIIVLSFLIRHVPAMTKGTWENVLWSLNAYKTLALAGGAFIIAASFFREKPQEVRKLVSTANLVLTGTVLMSLWLIIAGVSHFKFGSFVIDFIPSYIPFREFWTYFCGVALIAGGMGLLVKETRRLAALLSGIMIFSWFILLHIPRIIANPDDPSDRMGLWESLAMSGVLLVLAGLWRKK